MILSESVTTTGVNWESISVIMGGFGAAVAGLVAWTEHRQAQTRNQITDAVNHLAEVLTAKLETKETVNAINVRLARLEGSKGVSDGLSADAFHSSG
jgi:hypothetical protein